MKALAATTDYRCFGFWLVNGRVEGLGWISKRLVAGRCLVVTSPGFCLGWQKKTLGMGFAPVNGEPVAKETPGGLRASRMLEATETYDLGSAGGPWELLQSKSPWYGGPLEDLQREGSVSSLFWRSPRDA